MSTQRRAFLAMRIRTHHPSVYSNERCDGGCARRTRCPSEHGARQVDKRTDGSPNPCRRDKTHAPPWPLDWHPRCRVDETSLTNTPMNDARRAFLRRWIIGDLTLRRLLGSIVFIY